MVLVMLWILVGATAYLLFDVAMLGVCFTAFGNDVPPAHFQKMRSVYLYLAMDSAEEVERVYALLKDGGEVYMPLEKTFFASRFGMLRDRFGIAWTLLHEQPR